MNGIECRIENNHEDVPALFCRELIVKSGVVDLLYTT